MLLKDLMDPNNPTLRTAVIYSDNQAALRALVKGDPTKDQAIIRNSARNRSARVIQDYPSPKVDPETCENRRKRDGRLKGEVSGLSNKPNKALGNTVPVRRQPPKARVTWALRRRYVIFALRGCTLVGQAQSRFLVAREESLSIFLSIARPRTLFLSVFPPPRGSYLGLYIQAEQLHQPLT